jgi:hypothetical protein
VKQGTIQPEKEKRSGISKIGRDAGFLDRHSSRCAT